MKHSLRILVSFTTLTLLAPVGELLAQSGAIVPTREVLATLKPGQWIQLEGLPQKDGTVNCTEVKLLTGDLLDDNWTLRGLVRSVDAKNQQFTVAKYPIRLKDQVEYDDEAGGKFKSFSDLRVGMLVKLDGTYLKDGSFLCQKIDHQTAKIVNKPGIEKRVQLAGKIERSNPTKRSITAMGMTFFMTNNTKMKSVIK